MRMLVAGGAVFIGCNFLRYMLSKYQDIEIINLDLLTTLEGSKTSMISRRTHAINSFKATFETEKKWSK